MKSGQKSRDFNLKWHNAFLEWRTCGKTNKIGRKGLATPQVAKVQKGVSENTHRHRCIHKEGVIPSWRLFQAVCRRKLRGKWPAVFGILYHKENVRRGGPLKRPNMVAGAGAESIAVCRIHGILEKTGVYPVLNCSDLVNRAIVLICILNQASWSYIGTGTQQQVNVLCPDLPIFGAKLKQWCGRTRTDPANTIQTRQNGHGWPKEAHSYTVIWHQDRARDHGRAWDKHTRFFVTYGKIQGLLSLP